jgi:hypothetical protein
MAKKKEHPKGYTCKCGKYNPYPLYVYAHFREELIHTCDCGKKCTIVLGHATLRGKSKPTPPEGA